MKTRRMGVSCVLVGVMALSVSACSSSSSTQSKESLTVTLYKTQDQGQGSSIGTVTLQDTAKGLLITPDFHGVSPGIHGFHVHVNPSCAQGGQAAGGHWDPGHTNQHSGPYGNGHLGDLPALTADQAGNVTLPVLAPRVRLAALPGHSLMLHAGGDNYSDQPAKLGGGGARFACGVISSVQSMG